jgi:hypothetical protein
MSLTGIALVEAGRGNATAARGLAGEAVRMLDHSGDQAGRMNALMNLAAIEVRSSQADLSRRRRRSRGFSHCGLSRTFTAWSAGSTCYWRS